MARLCYDAANAGSRRPASFSHKLKEVGPLECRIGCGACCIGLSISSPIPGMPGGKPAGVRCVQLSHDNLCLLYGKAERPEVCRRLKAMDEMCGGSAAEALAYLAALEAATAPTGG